MNTPDVALVLPTYHAASIPTDYSDSNHITYHRYQKSPGNGLTLELHVIILPADGNSLLLISFINILTSCASFLTGLW